MVRVMAPLIFRPLATRHLHALAGWRYEAPYDFYDLSADLIRDCLDPALQYHVAIDESRTIVGYCCFGSDARVTGGDYGQVLADPLDIGVCLRPELTGRGLGRHFVRAVLSFAFRTYEARTFRVTIAAFNLRSRKTFERAGFGVTHHFVRLDDGVCFDQLEAPASAFRVLPVVTQP